MSKDLKKTLPKSGRGKNAAADIIPGFFEKPIEVLKTMESDQQQDEWVRTEALELVQLLKSDKDTKATHGEVSKRIKDLGEKRKSAAADNAGDAPSADQPA